MTARIPTVDGTDQAEGVGIWDALSRLTRPDRHLVLRVLQDQPLTVSDILDRAPLEASNGLEARESTTRPADTVDREPRREHGRHIKGPGTSAP
jgi:hypothetical protein